MNSECFDHVRRTRWIVAASVRKNRTDDPLVNLYRYDEQRNEKLSDVFHDLLPCKVTQEWATYFVILPNTYGRNSKEAEEEYRISAW